MSLLSLSLCISECFETQVDELLKQRDSIHASFTVSSTSNHVGASAMSNGSSSKSTGDDSKVENQGEDGTSDEKDKSFKKRWFNIPRGSDKKLG